MALPHHRKIKLIEFALDGENFECQVQNWKINNNTSDGEVLHTQCPEGEVREEPDPEYSLDLTLLSDWREDGISDFLVMHDGQVVDFSLDHHPDRPEEHVRFTGRVIIKAPSVGGETRTTEQTEITLPIEGKPLYTRAGDA